MHMAAHTHDFANWPFKAPLDTITFCTARVARELFPVLQVSHDHGGDWQFLDATEEDPGECVLLCFGCVYERDATLAEIADLPPGWSAFRREVGAEWERWANPPEDDDESGDHGCESKEAGEAKALADIAEHGLHVISVTEHEDSPPFTYSLGIEQSLGMPELIVVGLRSGVALSAINECYRRMKADPSLGVGSRISGLLGGDFECLLGEVSPARSKDYMFWTTWLYKGNAYRTMQIIYPSTSNVFPWEPEASDWFKNWQPLLDKVSALAA